MHNIGKMIAELHAMLKLHEKGIPKKAETPSILAIREGRIQKYKKKPQGDSICHHCKEVDHWRRNRRKMLAGLVLQGLRGSRRLKHRALSLYVGNGMRAAVEAIGSFDLVLPNGYALESAARILNMVPTKKVDRTSYEIWHGYPKETMGYYLYNPLENKIFVALNAEFFENSLTLQEASESHRMLEASGSEVGLELIQEDDTQTYKNTSKRHDEILIRDLNEPLNYKATLSNPEFEKWLDAISTKMQCMKDNQVWSLVDLHPNGRTVESKWLFKKKTDMDGNRSIYGLKQAYRSWNKRFDEEIKKIGFSQNPNEPCVYLKASRSNIAFLVLYVDDILIMGNNIAMLQDVKSWLCKCFSIKDLGEATYILIIKIIRDRSKRLISLSQSAYFDKILKKFKMENSKRGSTPMQEKPDYRKSQGAQTPSETDKDDTKSLPGYVFVLNGGVVDWKSAKQITTSMSSIEAEYIAAAKALMKAV
uniref:Reverse transcriptase Ty1/copia-type domain-containing protein n=1 Tax=Tanacetum cinerariifolium TaxID=118510 RepID=A0A699GRP4_TANCI|nr:hypothetical protein [Tanacetum cinerariifolium]